MPEFRVPDDGNGYIGGKALAALPKHLLSEKQMRDYTGMPMYMHANRVSGSLLGEIRDHDDIATEI